MLHFYCFTKVMLAPSCLRAIDISPQFRWLPFAWGQLNLMFRNLPRSDLTFYAIAAIAVLSSTRQVCSDEPVTLSLECNKVSQSEVFEVSTRHLCDQFRTINFDRPSVEVNQWNGFQWMRSDIETVLPTSGTGVLTIVYVHGNFMERTNALERVRIIDQYLTSQTDRPYRLIMLSWPSQREKRPLRDAVSNAEGAECQSLYLAWMLQRLRNESQLSVLGFSYGARAVTGALHLDAGGSIPGYAAVPIPRHDGELNYRLGLVAPALDRNWIESHGRHGLALSHVESMINLYNSRDPILRRFRFIDRLSRPIAAGFAGFAGLTGMEGFADPRATSPLAGQSRIQQFDCGAVIGTTHSEKSYYGECPYFRSMIKHLLWQDSREATCNAIAVP